MARAALHGATGVHELRLDRVLDPRPAGIHRENARADQARDAGKSGVVVNEAPDLLELAAPRLGHPLRLTLCRP